MKIREIIPFTTKEAWLKERLKDVTSTEASCLFGINPYETAFGLFHKKKDQMIIDVDPSERMTWGLRLQKAIAEGIAQDNKWELIEKTEYIRMPDLKIGASFDYQIKGENSILEIKNVDFFSMKDGWILEDGQLIEAPPHIEMQLQVQMEVADVDTGYIGALIGGNTTVLLKRHRDPEIIKEIEVKVKEFWNNLENNKEPAIDYEMDGKLISKLYNKTTEGSVLDARGNKLLEELVMEYDENRKKESIAAKLKNASKAKILQAIKDNEKVFSETYSISAGIVKGGPISYVREDYRNFKITMKKGGANE